MVESTLIVVKFDNALYYLRWICIKQFEFFKVGSTSEFHSFLLKIFVRESLKGSKFVLCKSN